jgi:hypothetical protein
MDDQQRGSMKKPDSSRREFVKKAAYVAPAVLSLQAFSAVAKAGSGTTEAPPPVTISPRPRRPRRR